MSTRAGTRGQREEERTSDPHLGYPGLLLLELTQSEDPGARLVVELLLEGVEQLHLLAKTAHTSGYSKYILYIYKNWAISVSTVSLSSLLCSFLF